MASQDKHSFGKMSLHDFDLKIGESHNGEDEY